MWCHRVQPRFHHCRNPVKKKLACITSPLAFGRAPRKTSVWILLTSCPLALMPQSHQEPETLTSAPGIFFPLCISWYLIVDDYRPRADAWVTYWITSQKHFLFFNSIPPVKLYKGNEYISTERAGAVEPAGQCMPLVHALYVVPGLLAWFSLCWRAVATHGMGVKGTLLVFLFVYSWRLWLERRARGFFFFLYSSFECGDSLGYASRVSWKQDRATPCRHKVSPVPRHRPSKNWSRNFLHLIDC